MKQELGWAEKTKPNFQGSPLQVPPERPYPLLLGHNAREVANWSKVSRVW